MKDKSKKPFDKKSGVSETLKNLNAKIAELKANRKKTKEEKAEEGETSEAAASEDEVRSLQGDAKIDRENERESQRGFTEGGASTKSSDNKNPEELEAEIAALESEQKKILEQLKELEEGQNKVKDLLDSSEVEESERNENEHFSFVASDKAMKLAKSIAGQYEAMGFECSIATSEKVITISVKMPEKFKDISPLKMTRENWFDAKSDLLEEKEKEGPQAEIEQDQSESWAKEFEDEGPRKGRTGLSIQPGGSWAAKHPSKHGQAEPQRPRDDMVRG